MKQDLFYPVDSTIDFLAFFNKQKRFRSQDKKMICEKKSRVLSDHRRKSERCIKMVHRNREAFLAISDFFVSVVIIRCSLVWFFFCFGCSGQLTTTKITYVIQYQHRNKLNNFSVLSNRKYRLSCNHRVCFQLQRQELHQYRRQNIEWLKMKEGITI